MKPTTLVQSGKNIQRQWHLVDASSETLGRVATKIAALLIGKDKPGFSYHLDQGDYVVAVNTDEIQSTGRKLRQKIYHFHSAYAGNMKEFSLQEMLQKDSRQVLYHAVLGMIPKNRLRDQRMARLKLFPTAQHSYQDKLKKE
ncbi:50S ribosomal protein L13 [Patescibacteria group bacterium]|nr:50S ribosomal protein L13 [Patescibacteria group bacterium]